MSTVYGRGFIVPVSGPSPVPAEPTVRFIDYDGTVLYAYSKEQALALSELPSAPTHQGLVTQGWNWSLASIKTSVNRGDTVDVGCFFKTDDDKVRLYIKLEEGATNFEFNFCQPNPDEVTIDWGDGTTGTTDTVNSSYGSEMKEYRASHTYSPSSYPAYYTITLINNVSEYHSIRFGGTSRGIFYNGYAGSITDDNRLRLYKIELSSFCSLGNYAFQNAYGLKSISVHNTMNIPSSCFDNCYRLKSVTTKDACLYYSISAYNNHSFYNCYDIESICLADPSDYINNGNSIVFNAYCCNNCYSLRRINNLSYAAEIRGNAFSNSEIEGQINLLNCTLLDTYAFSKTKINNINFPEIEVLGLGSLYSCEKLERVTIPSTVSSMDSTFIYDMVEGGLRYFTLQMAENGTIDRAVYPNNSHLEWIDLTYYTDPTAIPTMTSSFESVFPTTNKYNEKVVCYVKNNEMKAAFMSATNWSAGYYVVGNPPTDE